MAQSAQKYPISSNYTHNENESFGSFVSKGSLRIFQLKRVFDKLIRKKAEEKHASVMTIPENLYHEFDIKREIVQNRSLYTLENSEGKAKKIILYLHGGAFVYNVNAGQFQMTTEILRRSPAKLVIPDYPLAPHFHAQDTISMVRESYQIIQKRYGSDNVIILGDASGAGLALSLCELLRDEKKELPCSIILLNPWLDLSLTNPELKETSEHEIIQNITGLKIAADYYRGDIPVEDSRVSPIRGSLEGLPEINIFTGTYDLLYPDAKALRDQLKASKLPYRYFEFPKMMHGFTGTPYLRESQFVINQIISLI